MDGVQNPHDDYVNQQWVDLGSMQQQQQHHHHHALSPHHHHPQDYGAHYGYVDSQGFAPPDSPFRLQPPPLPIAPSYLGLPPQWAHHPQAGPNHHQHQQQYSSMPQPLAPAPPAPPPPPPPPLQTAAAAAASNPTQSTSSPRRTLTDADRRRMCVFHEENPNVKQTEIGAMFGVERSTVSKVLRQKEKYLFPDDGSRSPVKRSKGKFPDIERALSVWAKNMRKQGITLTDVMIREKARFFATSLGISDSHFKANSASWLEKFKHKNNVHPNGRGRSESDVTGVRGRHGRTDSIVSIANSSGIGGEAGDCGSPMMMKHSKSQDSTGTDSPESFMPMDFSGGGGYSNKFQQSGSVCSTPLSGTFTDADFLIGPVSPSSPFFSPGDTTGSTQPSPTGFPSQQARMLPHQRPRSQTFPLMPMDGNYISPPPSSEPLTPKLLHLGSGPLASPVPEMPNPLASPHMTPSSSPGEAAAAPSKDDAKKALEVVISFLRHQPAGFVEQDGYALGKLLEKFGISSGGSVGGAGSSSSNSNILS